jgi:hypothetical protein
LRMEFEIVNVLLEMLKMWKKIPTHYFIWFQKILSIT